MLVEEAVGRRDGLPASYEQISSGKSPGGVHVGDALEEDQETPGVRAHRRDRERPFFRAPPPEQREPRREAFREARRHVDRNLAGKSVRAAHLADEENRLVANS
jgi:hypothetical protein